MLDRIPLEREEAATFVAWLRISHKRFWHTPNETGSDAAAQRRAVRMKREGVSKGVPDYFVVTGTGLIAIELKRVNGSRTSPEQQQWIQTLNAAGVPAYVAKGAQQAIELVQRHS